MYEKVFLIPFYIRVYSGDGGSGGGGVGGGDGNGIYVVRL